MSEELGYCCDVDDELRESELDLASYVGERMGVSAGVVGGHERHRSWRCGQVKIENDVGVRAFLRALSGFSQRSLRLKAFDRAAETLKTPAVESKLGKPMSNEVRVESFSQPLDPSVRGFLHRPQNATGDALILTHGAGSNAQAPLLVALAETFSEHGFTVLRCNLPYRQGRSFGPPGPADAARDRAGLRNAIASVKELIGASTKETEVAPPLSRSVRQGGDFDFSESKSHPREHREGGHIFLAGHSYGGRQSSMLCAEEPNLVSGLLLLSYPLHPPRRPEQQRTQHLPDLRTPTLFVQGICDPFATIEELQKAIKMIPARTKLIPIEAAGHDLGFKGKAKQQDLPQLIFAEFIDFFDLSS